MSKQTAVEWLVERIQSDKIFSFKNVIEQALAMEREQIVEAFQTEWSQHNYSGKQYYANRYGKDANDKL